MQLVQILLTPDQAALLGAAADVTVRAHEAETLVVLTDEEKASYEQLAVFMGQVALNPTVFPVTGRLAATIKKRARELKGDAQTTSRKNKRKERQERRMRTHKARRIQRRETAEAYNQARTVMEAELAEMNAIHDERMAQIEAEDKFTVRDIMGNVIIDNVPESMIRRVEENIEQNKEILDRLAEGPATDYSVGGHEQFETPTKIILPGTAEALGLSLTSDDSALD